MKCPFCAHSKTRVIDSRPGGENNHIRRRRHCPGCGRRFTTFERPGRNFPMVVKRDGRLEPFNSKKMLAGIRRACTKLPVAEDQLSRVLRQVESQIQQSRRRRLGSQMLGDWVAAALLELHPAAYIRFSMVHRHIHDVQGLQKLLEEDFD